MMDVACFFGKTFDDAVKSALEIAKIEDLTVVWYWQYEYVQANPGETLEIVKERATKKV